MTAPKRKSPSANLSFILFDEVNGICPKCTKPLMNSNKTSGNRTKLFEVAHIYPHSPLASEVILLKSENRLNQDADHEDNLIALCRDCHKIFDNPRTVEGYREMSLIKKELQRLSKLKNSWFSTPIDQEINEVIAALASHASGDVVTLSLEALKIDEKADDTLNLLVKFKIKNNVMYFYSSIKDKFAALDRAVPYTSETIYSQVRTYYIQLKKDGHDQTQIFSALTNWIKNTTNCENTDVAEVLVSFFVQNCEVYS